MTGEMGHRVPGLVAPAQFARYLADTGWSLITEPDGAAVMWQKLVDRDNDIRDLRIVVPLTDESVDYREFEGRAVKVLAFAERRPERDVRNEILYGPVDVTSVRLTPLTPSGEAPLPMARDALIGLRDLLVGSASAIMKPGPVPPTYRPVADQFAERVRVSTSPGSFIVTANVPLDAKDPVDRAKMETEDLDDEERDLEVELDDTSATDAGTPFAAGEGLVAVSPPFGRLVVARMRAVAAASVPLAVDVARKQADLAIFEAQPAETGNSLELTALAEIGGLGSQSYTIRFSFSPAVTSGRPDPARYEIGREVRDVLGDAAERLRKPKPQENVLVTGRVIGLARGRKEKFGLVTVEGRIADGATYKYKARLSPDDYDRAVRAHRRGLDVNLRGDVVLRGHQYRVEPMRHLEVVGGLEDEP